MLYLKRQLRSHWDFICDDCVFLKNSVSLSFRSISAFFRRKPADSSWVKCPSWAICWLDRNGASQGSLGTEPVAGAEGSIAPTSGFSDPMWAGRSRDCGGKGREKSFRKTEVRAWHLQSFHAVVSGGVWP